MRDDQPGGKRNEAVMAKRFSVTAPKKCGVAAQFYDANQLKSCDKFKVIQLAEKKKNF